MDENLKLRIVKMAMPIKKAGRYGIYDDNGKSTKYYGISQYAHEAAKNKESTGNKNPSRKNGNEQFNWNGDTYSIKESASFSPETRSRIKAAASITKSRIIKSANRFRILDAYYSIKKHFYGDTGAEDDKEENHDPQKNNIDMSGNIAGDSTYLEGIVDFRKLPQFQKYLHLLGDEDAAVIRQAENKPGESPKNKEHKDFASKATDVDQTVDGKTVEPVFDVAKLTREYNAKKQKESAEKLKQYSSEHDIHLDKDPILNFMKTDIFKKAMFDEGMWITRFGEVVDKNGGFVSDKDLYDFAKQVKELEEQINGTPSSPTAPEPAAPAPKVKNPFFARKGKT